MIMCMHLHVNMSHDLYMRRYAYVLAKQLYDDIASIHVGEEILRSIGLKEKDGAKYSGDIMIGHLKGGEKERKREKEKETERERERGQT